MAFVSKYTEKIVAQQKGVRAAVKSQAEKVATRARGDLAAHRDEGDSKVTTSRGTKIDYFANLEDEAAAAIEWGDVHGDGTPVEGLHIMARAAGVRY